MRILGVEHQVLALTITLVALLSLVIRDVLWPPVELVARRRRR